MASKASDLVLDSKLESLFLSGDDDKVTEHIRVKAGKSARHRVLRSKESWRRKGKLGSGTYGTVWLEQCISGEPNGGYRAVKEILKSPDRTSSEFEYQRELEAVFKFSHDKYAYCFVRSFGWFENESSIFIAMEFAPHGDLQSYLTRPFSEPETQQIGAQVVEGVSFMHQNGFSHRDLKPGNILVFSPAPRWWVKIADFGISKRLQGATLLRTAQIGTFGYIAPEVLGVFCRCCPTDPETGDGSSYTVAVDVWAIGEIVFRMLTNQPSFPESRQLFNYVVQAVPFPHGPLSAVGASPECVDFIRTMMASCPRARITTTVALEHAWLKDIPTIDQSDGSSTHSHDSVENINPIRLLTPDELDEPSAAWTTVTGSTTKSIPTGPVEASLELKPANVLRFDTDCQNGVSVNAGRKSSIKNDSEEVTTQSTHLRLKSSPDPMPFSSGIKSPPALPSVPSSVRSLPDPSVIALENSRGGNSSNQVAMPLYTVQSPSEADPISEQFRDISPTSTQPTIQQPTILPEPILQLMDPTSFFAPRRLLGYINGIFRVMAPPAYEFEFDIVSYQWGAAAFPYDCGILGVTWPVALARGKLEAIKLLMVNSGLTFLWVDALCIDQDDEQDRVTEIAKIHRYYRNARRCHVLLDTVDTWHVDDIAPKLECIDRVLSHMGSALLASQATLPADLINRLFVWANDDWAFPIERSVMNSVALELGVLNAYSTCVRSLISLLDNQYFGRLWAFQEFMLGNNIAIWGSHSASVAYLGNFHTWSDLVSEAMDKAEKIIAWIENSRLAKSTTVGAILGVLANDRAKLSYLHIELRGINTARTDILNGGTQWWRENPKGVRNLFSVAAMRPRRCSMRQDVFLGLLGIFDGMFTQDEAQTMLTDHMQDTSFAFFRRLSIMTGHAWSRLAISGGERREWDWIPIENSDDKLVPSTDYYGRVFLLGRLNLHSQPLVTAITGIPGAPRPYIQISFGFPREAVPGFRFFFKGCNSSVVTKAGALNGELMPYDWNKGRVDGNETGRALVQCATILGTFMDPNGGIIAYRKRLLGRLQLSWRVSDPNAKPVDWIDRCVSGTPWEAPDIGLLKAHNRSMDLNMADISACESPISDERTTGMTCEILVNCGCRIIAPPVFMMEAIAAVEGSSLGRVTADLMADDRISLKDGRGLLQLINGGRHWQMVAFSGDAGAHKSYASRCRSSSFGKRVIPKESWPKRRALVRAGFHQEHRFHFMRDYGYVDTEGCGNILLSRNSLVDSYKAIGVCIDDTMGSSKSPRTVTMR